MISAFHSSKQTEIVTRAQSRFSCLSALRAHATLFLSPFPALAPPPGWKWRGTILPVSALLTCCCCRHRYLFAICANKCSVFSFFFPSTDPVSPKGLCVIAIKSNLVHFCPFLTTFCVQWLTLPSISWSFQPGPTISEPNVFDVKDIQLELILQGSNSVFCQSVCDSQKTLDVQPFQVDHCQKGVFDFSSYQMFELWSIVCAYSAYINVYMCVQCILWT